MSKHTPGPWEAVFNDSGDHGTHYIVCESGVIGYWHGHKSHHTDNFWRISEADARLIAAAPELLEACIKAREWLDGWASADPYIGVLETAIAKATGADNA